MTDSVVVKITGIENVNRRLHQIADDIQRRILVASMKEAMKKMLAEAESRAPVGQNVLRRTKKRYQYSHRAGGLKRSFRLRKTRVQNPFELEVRLENMAYYALWVEYGHRLVKGRGRQKRVIGHVAPTPFMRPAFDAQSQKVIDTVASEIDRRLTRRGV